MGQHERIEGQSIQRKGEQRRKRKANREREGFKESKKDTEPR